MRSIDLANKKFYVLLKEKAKKMRTNPTEAENKLWPHLKNQKIGNKFRRQHIIDQFIVDFCCLDKKLIIELDGRIHEEQKGRDSDREQRLINHGFQIIRFTNEQILNEIEIVLSKIKKYL